MDKTDEQCPGNSPATFRERKQTNETNTEMEERFRVLVENTPDAFIIHCEGRIVNINPAGLKLLGIKDPAGVLGKSALEFVHPGDRAEVSQRISDAMRTGSPAPTIEERFILPDGTTIFVQVTGIPILLHDKPAMQVIIRDISEQKRIEKELLLHQKEQSLIINALPVIFYKVAPIGLLPTVWISDQVYQLTGYTPSDFISDPLFWENKLHPEDKEKTVRKLNSVLFSDTVSLEYRFMCADGTWHWFEDRLVVVRDQHGNPVDSAGLWLDITNRKKTEVDLMESESKYRLLAEYSHDVIWIMNPEQRFSFVSPSVEKLRGFTACEAMQQTMAEIMTPESYQRALDRLKRISEQIRLGEKPDDPVPLELEQYRKDGSTIWTESIAIPHLDGSGNIIQFIGVTRDISERRQVRQELIHAGMRFRGLIEHAPDAVVMVDTLGKFLYASPPAFKMFGYREDEFDSLSPDALTHPDDLPEVLSVLQKLMTDPSMVPTIQYRFRHKSGEWRWIESTFSNLLDVEGIGGIVINFRDITQRKQDETELISARNKAEESDRLKSAFLANMSHEIRTPMNAIVGFSEMLTDPDISSEEKIKYTQIIKNRSGDLMHIINDLLEISRLESGMMKAIHAPLDLNILLDEIYMEFSRKIQDKKPHLSLSIEKALPTTSAVIVSDGHILRQVYSNLLDNAVKYTIQGGIHFGYTLTENSFITCFVKDTGIGISEENQQIIFQHFRRAEFEGQQQYSGTGLGLSICKGSIEILGGSISVESEPGQGSIFRFTIPCKTPPNGLQVVSAGRKPQPVKTHYNWTGKNILLVEDEEANMDFLKIIFNKTGANLFPAFNAGMVRDFYTTLDKFDLVLMDVRLPDASGWDLTAEIRLKKPDLPIIAQTAYAMASDRQRCEEAGCSDFISKPIRKELLLQMVSKYFDL